MLQARYTKYILDFLFEARTSRGAMWQKPTYFVEVWDDSDPQTRGLGECNHFPGLSPESEEEFEAALQEACDSGLQKVAPMSGLLFGMECAMAQLRQGGGDVIFPSGWTAGEHSITINGLVWMGHKQLMLERIKEKLDRGFGCLKLKIGGIDFADELELLHFIRKAFSKEALQLRLDANGAFSPSSALQRLEQLSAFDVHSIEQPIKQGQIGDMARICASSPIPVGLDEELIGVRSDAEKAALLDAIRPQYVILKPALCGGLTHSDKWISLAEERGIGWWATSALESNVGLSALSQWLGTKRPSLPQGLGTGNLYSNNLPSAMRSDGQRLIFCGESSARSRASEILWP